MYHTFLNTLRAYILSISHKNTLIMKYHTCSILQFRNIAFSATLIFTTLCTAGCQSKDHAPSEDYSEARKEAEVHGIRLLTSARKSLEEKDFEQSKKYIKELRTSYPLATTARREALLLWDSIGWMEAEMRLHEVDTRLQSDNITEPERDSLQAEFEDMFNRIKFYKRKLNHDKQELNNEAANKTASEHTEKRR